VFTDPTSWDGVKKYYSRKVCLCSSRDGVPWGMVNDTCQQYRFSCGLIDTNFDPPQFPLDSTFKDDLSLGRHQALALL
jgi:hypothetical protein